MARIKKTSKVLENARIRLAAVRSIAGDFNIGSGLSTDAFAAKINNATELLETYNTTLSIVDEQLHAFETAEHELGDIYERVLLSVASTYGKDSIEYEKAGGTRKSDRRKPVRAKSPSAS